MDRSELLKASPPMFKSGLLDRFTRVHHLVPVALFGPAITILFVLGADRLGLLSALGFAAGGYPSWSSARSAWGCGARWVSPPAPTVLDARRVLDPPRDLPLRARAGRRCAAALDDPRRPPRSPERPAAARDAAGRLDPAGARVLRAVRARTRR